MSNKKAVELLETIKDSWVYKTNEDGIATTIAETLEVLALLQKPKLNDNEFICGSCKGTGKVSISKDIKIPDCQIPEAGELTKELRAFGVQMLTIHCLDEIQCKRLCQLIVEVCDFFGSKDEQIKQLQIDFDKAKKMLDEYEHEELEAAPLLIKISKLQAEEEKLKEALESVRFCNCGACEDNQKVVHEALTHHGKTG